MELKCITTSLEYQILDSIREKLKLPSHRLKAPRYEMNEYGQYVRHCRLIVRERHSFLKFQLPSAMMLGLDLNKSIIEIYSIHHRSSRHKSKCKNFGGNRIYGKANLCDPQSLTIKFLRNFIKEALLRAYGNSLKSKKPLHVLRMTYPTVGPYVEE